VNNLKDTGVSAAFLLQPCNELIVHISKNMKYLYVSTLEPCPDLTHIKDAMMGVRLYSTRMSYIVSMSVCQNWIFLLTTHEYALFYWDVEQKTLKKVWFTSLDTMNPVSTNDVIPNTPFSKHISLDINPTTHMAYLGFPRGQTLETYAISMTSFDVIQHCRVSLDFPLRLVHINANSDSMLTISADGTFIERRNLSDLSIEQHYRRGIDPSIVDDVSTNLTGSMFSVFNRSSGTLHVFNRDNEVNEYGLQNTRSLFKWLKPFVSYFDSTWSAFQYAFGSKSLAWSYFCTQDQNPQAALFTIEMNTFTNTSSVFITTFDKDKPNAPTTTCYVL
jgi:hypothetical protein